MNLPALLARDSVLCTALALSLVAGVCSAAGGLVAVLLEGPQMSLQRMALWHAAMGAGLLFLSLCDILPEAAAGLSTMRVSVFFALGASSSISLSYLLGALTGHHTNASLRAHSNYSIQRLLRIPRQTSDYSRSESGLSGQDSIQDQNETMRRRPPSRFRHSTARSSQMQYSQTHETSDDQHHQNRHWLETDQQQRRNREPHTVQNSTAQIADPCDCRDVLAVGLTTFFSLSAHNLLEGMSILLAAHEGLEKGIRLAAAVSLENFPEGMMIALPIMYATGCPVTAVRLALCSGMVEPLGVLILGVILRPWMSQPLVSSLLAVIAGIFASLSVMVILPLAVKTANLQNNGEFNKWIAFGVIFATLFQPLLIYHGRVGLIR